MRRGLRAQLRLADARAPDLKRIPAGAFFRRAGCFFDGVLVLFEFHSFTVRPVDGGALYASRAGAFVRTITLLAIALALATPLPAATYVLNDPAVALIGSPATETAQSEDTLLDVARRNGLGYEEIIRANPGVDTWLPGAGRKLALPTQRIIPGAAREGIVVNLPEHRLYYFPKPRRGAARTVITYAVSIGRMDWATPLGLTQVAAKNRNPTWYPPKAVLEEHEANGDPIPPVVPPGPDNPLGAFAMRLAIPGGAYLIHGTNKPAGVGMQITHGCMRLYPEDIEALFPLVPLHAPVRIINEPVKLGWVGEELYMEAHRPLDRMGEPEEPDLKVLEGMLLTATADRPVAINWDLARATLAEARGIPTVVAIEVVSETDPALAPAAPQQP
jgi:L,D-transpeptidase ErfK/SrfK